MNVNLSKEENNGNSAGDKVNNRCNLIVNYLPQSLKEQDFNLLFSKLGPLKTCKLMFDRQTGYSFGYGFVEYVNESDAIKAIEMFNGYQMEHKRLKVALARPNNEETKNTNLYIRNLPISYDESQLAALFSQFGDVVQVRILRDQNTSFSRRIGFVIMSTKPMAQTAIQQLDNTIPNGGTEPIYVKYADEEGKRRHPPSSNNLSQNQRGFGQQHLNDNFLQQPNSHGFNFGNSPNSFMMSAGSSQNQLSPLNLGKIKTNRNNGHQNRYNPIGAGSTGFDNLINTIGTGSNSGGYSQFSNFNQQQQQQQPNHQLHQFNNSNFNLNTVQAAAAAMAAAAAAASLGSGSNLLDLSGPNTSMEIKAGAGPNSSTNSGSSPGHIIYVYGIGQANESDLYSLFSNCGRILRVNVIKNQKTGQCKGYGFVVFETYEEAYYAVHNMNGFMYNHRPLQVQLNAGHVE